MPIISWRDQMSLNYLPLDQEHQSFLQVVNQAIKAANLSDFKTMDY